VFPEPSNERLYRYITQNPPVDVAALTARYQRLAEQPHSPDGSELWLNRVMRARRRPVCRTLEASVTPGREATIAYFVYDSHQRKSYPRECVGALVLQL
jgi:hypothetical protein